jgi:hypothetical protein
MNQIIIFRFHNKLEICKNKLKLLNKLNTNTPIYGIYGGGETDANKVNSKLNNLLKDIYIIKNRTIEWKWKNFDLILSDWFKNFGHTIKFDQLIVVEWDLLFIKPIKELYSHIDINEVGLTGLSELNKHQKEWMWTSKEPYESEWRRMLSFIKKEYKYNKSPKTCLGPGVCLPRIYLEKMQEYYIPPICHEEIRYPLNAQLFGLKIKDTGFRKFERSDYEDQFFNCENKEIKQETINEFTDKKEKFVFHPVTKLIDNEQLIMKN